MITTFGPAAALFAGRLGKLDAIVTDVASLPSAYLHAVERRVRGETFYGMVLFDDRRTTVTYEVAASVIGQTADPDQRDMTLRMLGQGSLVINGKPSAELWADPVESRMGAFEFYMLCDAVLVRSYAEYAWVASLYRERPMPPMERIVSVRELPQIARVAPTQPGIVIWAPHRDAMFVALHVDALADVHGEITVVAAQGGLPGTLPSVLVVAPDDPRAVAALARATCVVCAEPNDPGDAIAFARLGYGVVAPLTSGAHEYVDDVQLWDGLYYYQLYTAVVTALGRPSSARGLPPAPRPLAVPVPPLPVAELPLVTIIVPTYNRPDMLARLVDAVEAQTYPNIELMIVNDCGSAVDHVIAGKPFARLINQETNTGAMRACATGFAASRGEYIMFVADDDSIYPDHVARIMDGLLRAGATFAHSSMLLRYLATTDDGREELRGFNAQTFSRTMNLVDTLLASTVAVNQCIQHRRVFAEAGWFLNDSSVADNEFHLRMLQRYTPVFVPHVTCEFRDHQRTSLGKSNDLAGGLREMYEIYHPYPGRPVLADLRRQTLENVARRPPGQSPFSPTIRIGGRAISWTVVWIWSRGTSQRWKRRFGRSTGKR